MVGPAMIVWHIWKERNKRIFKEISIPIERLIDKIKVAIKEVLNGKPSEVRKYKYNEWDRDMERYWSFKEIGSTHSPVKKVDREAIKWNAPPKGWVKLNFDGVSKGNPRESGFRAIIRNESG
ncbi:uncharacterized protein LOC131067803 [Cryptomeria japonica]|uniref:uncharacterized protein LOC131067803 n=1 Tax=Cryptomeria japonica TaxID=3369 RepID=UPI0027DA6AC1|nr:uncharacterized protein LOC131067803 [Cryptomeria japonica]